MDGSPVNATDVVIVLVIVASGLFAFFRGFVHEMLSVTSWIGAALATIYGLPYAIPHARRLITEQVIADIGAGVAIFLTVLIVLSILTHIISHRIRKSALGPLDRSLGLVFGVFRGAVLVCVAWLVFAWLLPREDHPAWITEAKARPLVERGSTMLVTLLPKRMRGEAGAPSGAAERPRAADPGYENLLNPRTKGGASETEPGYNSRMREEMRRAIEGIARPEEGAE